MQIISDSQLTQMRGRPPATPDVPTLSIKSKALHNFTRRVDLGTIVASTTVDISGAFAFKLSDLNNYTEYTSLFDQYRILQINIDFEWILGANSGNSPLYIALDYDDNTVPTSALTLYEYDTVSTHVPGATATRNINPHIAVALYGGAFTAFGNSTGRHWVDAASPGVFYYGVKYSIPAATNNTTTPCYRVTARYVVQCRSQH